MSRCIYFKLWHHRSQWPTTASYNMLGWEWSNQICHSTQVATAWGFIVSQRATLTCVAAWCSVLLLHRVLISRHSPSGVKWNRLFFWGEGGGQRKAFSAFPPASLKVRMPPSSAAAAPMLIPFAVDWLQLTSYVSSSLVFFRVSLLYLLAILKNIILVSDNFCIFGLASFFFSFVLLPANNQVIIEMTVFKWQITIYELAAIFPVSVCLQVYLPSQESEML